MSAEGIYISSFLDEQQLLTIYINQYNQINTHIDTLLNMLDEIKTNIINIIRPRRTLINRHTHTNRHNNNHRYPAKTIIQKYTFYFSKKMNHKWKHYKK